ncbi:testis-expressed protein 45 [Sorex araneus]|uniref:testis-expressed protein 45 n=1 Tax=Sorex araneus TaxID=42254 RepID=UPI002433E53E|nr:testis-expressed protein 45 [Sorex araneus]
MASSAFLPRPLPAGREITQTSHFSLGPDLRLQTGTRQTTSHRHFPAYDVAPVVLLRPRSSRHPFLPTLPSSAVAQAVAEAVSEAHGAFTPLPPQQPADGHALVQARTLAMQSSHVPLEADARTRTAVSTARAGYGWQQRQPRDQELALTQRLIFGRDSVPKGDLSKPRLLATTYQDFFPPYHSCPHLLPHSDHTNPLQWDRRTHNDDTSYKRQFLAPGSTPALMCARATSSIKLGDVKLGSGPMCSEKKEAFVPQGLPPDRYDKAQASAHVHFVHIRPGDDLFRGETTKALHFYAQDPEPFVIYHEHSPQSHILEGNGHPGPGSLTTSTKLCHGQPFTMACKPGTHHIPHEELQSHVSLGDPMMLDKFFRTTMGTHYAPSDTTRIPLEPTLHLLESNLPKGTGETDFLTFHQKMMKPHKPHPATVTEEQLRRCKYSHIEPPLGTERFLSTLYNHKYPWKYEGPVVLAVGTNQESHLPLGTMHQRSCKANKVNLQAPQSPIYPCPSQQ